MRRSFLRISAAGSIRRLHNYNVSKIFPGHENSLTLFAAAGFSERSVAQPPHATTSFCSVSTLGCETLLLELCAGEDVQPILVPGAAASQNLLPVRPSMNYNGAWVTVMRCPSIESFCATATVPSASNNGRSCRRRTYRYRSRAPELLCGLMALQDDSSTARLINSKDTNVVTARDLLRLAFAIAQFLGERSIVA